MIEQITVFETLLKRLVDTKLNHYQQLVLVTALRRLISNQQEPPVTQLLQTKILSFISDIFGFKDKLSEEIRAMKVRTLFLMVFQFEAIWILTNLAFGSEEDVKQMFSDPLNLLGCIDTLLKESINDTLMLEQIMWLLGNITGDSIGFRNLIIQGTCIFDVLSQVTKGKSISRTFLRTMCWLNANLNRYKGLTID